MQYINFQKRISTLNNWLRKSPAAPWKSLVQTQQSEAQLNVVVKDGEEIGATILYFQRTPTEIRRQTKKRPFPGPPTVPALATV